MPGCAPIEDGIHTYDIFEDGKSKQKVGTKEFAQAVAAARGTDSADSESCEIQVRRRSGAGNQGGCSTSTNTS